MTPDIEKILYEDIQWNRDAYLRIGRTLEPETEERVKKMILEWWHTMDIYQRRHFKLVKYTYEMACAEGIGFVVNLVCPPPLAPIGFRGRRLTKGERRAENDPATKESNAWVSIKERIKSGGGSTVILRGDEDEAYKIKLILSSVFDESILILKPRFKLRFVDKTGIRRDRILLFDGEVIARIEFKPAKIEYIPKGHFNW